MPSKKDVVQAILSYSPQLLRKHLEAGYDVNLALYGALGDIETFRWPLGDNTEIPENKKVAVASGGRVSSMAYPLHIAVACLYHAVKHSYMRSKALEIIDILLDHGASPGKGCGDLLLLNIQGYEFVLFHRDWPKNMPVHLAAYLKQYPWFLKEDETHRCLDIAIDKLEKAAAAALNGGSRPKTTPVLSSVASSYGKMLFSEDFSDVAFHCSDGVSIPAHKCILAANSEYFKTAFQGPWAENADGRWKTPHPSKLIKAVLAVLYSGSAAKCDELARDADPVHLFEIASEYDIKALKSIAVGSCINSLHSGNVRDMLQMAKLHSNKNLKQACFQYVRNNAVKVLMDPGVMSLATEDPKLWKELGDYANSSKPNKRQKTA